METGTVTTRERTDLIDLLVADHNEAKSLLMSFDHLDATSRTPSFRAVVQMVKAHERAEEDVVYPALRRDAPGGDAIADARLSEQAGIEEVLAELEKLEMDEDRFIDLFASLRESVLEHADREERETFPVLRASIGDDELDELGRRYVQARQVAPSHPDPFAHCPATRMALVEPVAAAIDHLRDAVRTRS
jgi:hemerythrin superfamily protein